MTQATEKDIGKWCKFYGTFPEEVLTIAKLSKIEGLFCYRSRQFVADAWTLYCEPLTQKQIKFLGLEE